MVPILVNKDVFECSYNDLKFMDQNCNYNCTNLIVEIQLSGFRGIIIIIGRKARGKERYENCKTTKKFIVNTSYDQLHFEGNNYD